MHNIEHDYLKLLKDILDNGIRKDDRTGTGTISVFGRQIRHNMKLGFPLLTTKKMAWKVMVTELLWFLKGDTNIKYLVDNNCHIWDGDAYKAYEKWYDEVAVHSPFNVPTKLTQDELIKAISLDSWHAEKFGDLGPIYGAQWREWGARYETNQILGTRTRRKPGIDQIAKLVEDLKTNPDSRRLMVNAWNVGEISQMTLPPCHYGFQVWTRELSFDERWSLYSGKQYDGNLLGVANTLDFLDDENVPTRAISLQWSQRSADCFLGVPFNIASYALLLTLIADEVNMVPDELIGNLGDTHLYLNHIDQAKEQLTRSPMTLPTVKVQDGIHCSSHEDILLEGYESHPAIKAPLSN